LWNLHEIHDTIEGKYLQSEELMVRKVILLIMLAAIFTLAVYGDSEEREERIVFIRVDNIFMRYTDIEPQEIDGFLNVVEEHDARAILSVIPARLRQGPNIDGKMSEQLLDYARRGHQIAQNGYDHICPFTENTSYEFYNPDVENGYSREERLSKIEEGKKMLEAVTGRKVVNFVGTGADHEYMPEEDLDALFDMGFIQFPSDREKGFDAEENKLIGLRVASEEYTWGLTEENYDERMEQFQQDFLETAETEKKWSFHIHDHFTREAYNDGIVLKWMDEALDWLQNLEKYEIKHPTLEEYYRQYDPDFCTEFE